MQTVRYINTPAGRVIVLSFVAVVLNIVAASIKVSTPWVIVLLVLALVASLVMEYGTAGKRSESVNPGNDIPATNWTRLIVWALVSTVIGMIISAISLLVPHGLTLRFFAGGIFGHIQVGWHLYDVLSVIFISLLAVGIAIRRRSVVTLILFVLFSTSGMTLTISTFAFDDWLLVRFATAATVALVVSVLVFYRSMIAELCREAWGGSFPWQFRGRADAEVEELPRSEDAI